MKLVELRRCTDLDCDIGCNLIDVLLQGQVLGDVHPMVVNGVTFWVWFCYLEGVVGTAETSLHLAARAVLRASQS